MKAKSLFFICLFYVFSFYAVSVEVLDDIASLCNKKSNIPIVAIAGCPGVGKTTFAKKLEDELLKRGIKSKVVSFDHFRKVGLERKELRNELDIMRINWNEVHRVLKEIKQGKKHIKKPVINQLTKETSEEILNLNQIDLIIFEGMYSIANASPMDLLSYMDLGIYMETTAENICDWKWEREAKKLHPRNKDEFDKHMTLIFEDFLKFVYPTKKNANWVLFVDDFHNVSKLFAKKP